MRPKRWPGGRRSSNGAGKSWKRRARNCYPRPTNGGWCLSRPVRSAWGAVTRRVPTTSAPPTPFTSTASTSIPFRSPIRTTGNSSKSPATALPSTGSAVRFPPDWGIIRSPTSPGRTPRPTPTGAAPVYPPRLSGRRRLEARTSAPTPGAIVLSRESAATPATW